MKRARSETDSDEFQSKCYNQIDKRYEEAEAIHSDVDAKSDQEIQSKKIFSSEYTDLVRFKCKVRRSRIMKQAKFHFLRDIEPETDDIFYGNGECSKSLRSRVNFSLHASDIQSLVTFSLGENRKTIGKLPLNFCRLLRYSKLKNVVCLVLDNVSSDDYMKHTDIFKPLTEIYTKYEKLQVARLNTPSISKHNIADEFFCKFSLSNEVPDKINKLDKVEVSQSPIKKPTPAATLSNIEQIDSSNFLSRDACQAGGCSVVDLLMDQEQMVEERIPVQNDKSSPGFVCTKSKYKPVTTQSPLFAVDCEMVLTRTPSGLKSELARVSIVDQYYNVFYDSLVKPRNVVADYVTRYSGITFQMLRNETTRIEDVQTFIHNHLPSDAILCGHSISNDLRSLMMYHPYIIDTSVIYNNSGNRKIKIALRRLTKHFLGRSIQTSASGHSSYEDAAATLELVLLKLKNGIEFGDCILSNVVENIPHIPKHIYESESPGKPPAVIKQSVSRKKHYQLFRETPALIEMCQKFNKTVAIIDSPDLINRNFIDENTKVCTHYRADSLIDKLHQCETAFSQHFLNWIRLPGFEETLNENEQQDKLACLVETVMSAFELLKDNSLIITILTGRNCTNVQHGLVFIKNIF